MTVHKTIQTVIMMLIVAIIALLVTQPAPSQAASMHRVYRPAPERFVRLAERTLSPRHGTPAYRAWVICKVWHRVSCRAVLNVAWCESGFDPRSRLGQYLGVMQMGTRERATYGHGSSVWAQAAASLRYWNRSHWQPWQCSPVPIR